MKGRKEEQESGNGRSLNVLWNSSLPSSVFWRLTVSQNRNHGNRQLQHYIFKASQPEMLGKKPKGGLLLARVGSHASSLTTCCMRTVFCGPVLTGAEGGMDVSCQEGGCHVRLAAVPHCERGSLYPFSSRFRLAAVPHCGRGSLYPFSSTFRSAFPFPKAPYTLEASRSLKKL